MAEDTKPIAMEDRSETGERLFSPSAGRNSDAIAAELAARLPRDARVLEIGSGTGEHAESLCRIRPDISWTPSDPDARSRVSIAARAAEIENLGDPLALNLLDAGWQDLAPRADALVCNNVIHIAPYAVAEALAAYAGENLPAGGLVCLYGAYLEGGASAPSNLVFSEDLKRRNPSWGVRELDDVKALFARHGLTLDARVEMAANNLFVAFRAGE